MTVSAQVEKLPIWSETAGSKMSAKLEVRSDDWTDPDVSHMDLGTQREGGLPSKLHSGPEICRAGPI